MLWLCCIVQLTDADEGVNAEVEFVEIVEGIQNEELLFGIGPDGNLTTSRSVYTYTSIRQRDLCTIAYAH